MQTIYENLHLLQVNSHGRWIVLLLVVGSLVIFRQLDGTIIDYEALSRTFDARCSFTSSHVLMCLLPMSVARVFFHFAFCLFVNLHLNAGSISHRLIIRCFEIRARFVDFATVVSTVREPAAPGLKSDRYVHLFICLHQTGQRTSVRSRAILWWWKEEPNFL